MITPRYLSAQTTTLTTQHNISGEHEPTVGGCRLYANQVQNGGQDRAYRWAASSPLQMFFEPPPGPVIKSYYGTLATADFVFKSGIKSRYG